MTVATSRTIGLSFGARIMRSQVRVFGDPSRKAHPSLIGFARHKASRAGFSFPMIKIETHSVGENGIPCRGGYGNELAEAHVSLRREGESREARAEEKLDTFLKSIANRAQPSTPT